MCEGILLIKSSFIILLCYSGHLRITYFLLCYRLHPGQLRITILTDLAVYLAINEPLLFFPIKLSKSAQYMKVQRQRRVKSFAGRQKQQEKATGAPNAIVKN